LLHHGEYFSVFSSQLNSLALPAQLVDHGTSDTSDRFDSHDHSQCIPWKANSHTAPTDTDQWWQSTDYSVLHFQDL